MPQSLLMIRAQIQLVGVLHIHEVGLELRIIDELFQGPQFVEVGFPAVSDFWVIRLLRRGLQARSQRRGVIPFVLLLNFPG